MSRADHERLTAHYLALAALTTDDRRRRLAGMQGTDPELWSELRSLFVHEDDVPPILRTGAGARLISRDPPPPVRVGRYRIAEAIGEGGMGIVYRAELRDPEPRDVAIKFLRASAMGEYAQARFEIERRALGRMDHPNVARVLDGGVLADGRPYVVMEYVDGEPITAFCDRHELSIDDRLRLFSQVCHAVHHAHQRAILHRDIKPSNVLVSFVDGVPVPKVIDFGIAKPLAPGVHDATLTQTGQILGTPAYMSPEQALSIGDPVDIRADVYSLGALLHELLAGSPPFDPDELRRAGPDRMRRILLDVDPPRPSLRLAHAGAAAIEVARRRRAEPRGLSRRLRGELDWIVLKALARERSDRYAAASELGADLARYLRHEPVEARPPSTLYRARKFAQRHRTGTALVVVLVPLIFAFSVTMAYMARRAAAERDKAEELSSFLVHFYEGPLLLANRQGARKPGVVMAEGLERLDRELGDRPVLRERVRQVIGSALEGFGGADKALPVLQTAHARLEDLLGREHPETLAAADALGRALAQLERLDEAEALWKEVLEARRRVLGRKHPDTLRTLVELGNVEKILMRVDLAIEALGEARAGMIEVLGWEDRDTGMAAAVLGAALLDARRLDEAQAVIEEALGHLAPDHPERIFAVYNLACVHALRGERDAAIENLRQAVDAGFSLIFFGDGNLASLFDDPEFEQLNRSASLIGLKAVAKVRGDAEALIKAGDLAAAQRLLRAALDAMPSVGSKMELVPVLARSHLLAGRFEDARPLVEEELRRARAEHPDEAHVVASRIWRMSEVLAGLGERESASRILEEAEGLLEAVRKPYLRGDLSYTRALQADLRGDREGALRALREAVDNGLHPNEYKFDGIALASIRDSAEYKALHDRVSKRFFFSP